jgi:hypothetical protein
MTQEIFVLGCLLVSWLTGYGAGVVHLTVKKLKHLT